MSAHDLLLIISLASELSFLGKGMSEFRAAFDLGKGKT